MSIKKGVNFLSMRRAMHALASFVQGMFCAKHVLCKALLQTMGLIAKSDAVSWCYLKHLNLTSTHAGCEVLYPVGVHIAVLF